jgi:hypothetical protein
MAEKTLKDILISRRELDRYYGGVVPVNLWRALNVRRGGGLFDLVEVGFTQSNDRFRPADVTIEDGWVRLERFPRGVSTFDKRGTPRGKDWEYYLIPAGTQLPDGRAVVRDSYNESFEATHYTIAPDWEMRIEVFRCLLDKLASIIADKKVA